MIDVIIIGAGGHAAEIDEYIIYNKKHSVGEDLNIVGFLDDDPENYRRYQFSAPLIGSASDHEVIRNHYYILGIAGIKYRRILWSATLPEVQSLFQSYIMGRTYQTLQG